MLAAVGQALSQASGIYKWSDERGITHYSQDPPAQGRFTRLESGHPTAPPAPLCKRALGPRWQDFFCRFMTQELWRMAGHPRLRDPRGGAQWIPLFYRGGSSCIGDCTGPGGGVELASGSFPASEGLIEGFEQETGGGAGVAPARYAPWSVHIKRRLGCSDEQTSNPYWMARARLPRSELLGFGWDKLVRDAGDPTDDSEAGSMFVLFTAANLRALLEPEQARLIDEHALNQIAFGTTALMRPDFERNAEMALVRPEGTVESLRDTALAIEALSKVGTVVTNDAGRGWVDAVADAVNVAQHFQTPTVLIYNAADFFSLERDNLAVRDRLRALANGVNRRSGGLNVVSHGWGSYLAIAALHTYPRVSITAFGAYPGPWRVVEYMRALRESQAKITLVHGQFDVIASLGGGGGVSAESPSCLPVAGKPAEAPLDASRSPAMGHPAPRPE